MNVALASLGRWLRGADRVTGRGKDGRWVVVDTETSGTDPTADRLLAVGGVGVDATGILLGDSFEIVLKSDAPVDAANIAVHGIGRGAQATGTPARDALSAFREWAADAPRVGFHADFDRTALRIASARAEIAEETMPWLDLAPLAAALVPDAYRRGSRSLDDWLAAFGIECSTRHNAGSDALATAELLLTLRALAAKQGALGFEALVRTSRAQKWLGAGRT